MQCQERGLGWDLGGALGWRQLQLVGSEVTNRCPSQPPALGCWSFVRVLISICQISLICNSGVHKGKWKKTQYKVGNCFLVAFDGLPAQATNEQFIFWCAAWHTIDATLKNKKLHGLLYFSTPGITLSSIFSLCPQTQACQNSYLFRRQYFSSLWGLETLFRPGSLEEYKETALTHSFISSLLISERNLAIMLHTLNFTKSFDFLKSLSILSLSFEFLLWSGAMVL